MFFSAQNPALTRLLRQAAAQQTASQVWVDPMVQLLRLCTGIVMPIKRVCIRRRKLDLIMFRNHRHNSCLRGCCYCFRTAFNFKCNADKVLTSAVNFYIYTYRQFQNMYFSKGISLYCVDVAQSNCTSNRRNNNTSN
jgi:hypothetical protein